MVKVLENRVVDLDLMPGKKERQQAVAKHGVAKNTKTEHSFPKHPSNPHAMTSGENATNAGRILALTVGDTVKSIVDTTSNTVGALGSGLFGTVTGVGKGLGAAASYGSHAIGGAGHNIGRGMGLKKKGDVWDDGGVGDESSSDEDEVGGRCRVKGRRMKRDIGTESGRSDSAERFRGWKEREERNIEALEKFEQHEGIRMPADDRGL